MVAEPKKQKTRTKRATAKKTRLRKSSEPKNHRGRPAKWDPKYVAVAKSLAQLGATDLEIANAFAVDIRTIYRWKLEYAEFRDALTIGKDVANSRVEDSLFRLATGYTFDEEHIMSVAGEIHRLQTVKHVPPNPTSVFFWLQNRDPDRWRSTKHIKHDVEPDSPLQQFLDDISGRSIQPKTSGEPQAPEKGRGIAPKAG